MIRMVYACFLFLLVAGSAAAQNPKAAAGRAPNPRQNSTSFSEKLLKFLGISASPNTLKGPGDELVDGELWVADLEMGNTFAQTPDGGYRSPVFVAGTTDILALRGAQVVRVASGGGETKRLFAAGSVIKLVGFGVEDPDQVLVLLKGGTDGRPRVGLLNAKSGAITALPYDPASDRDLQMVESLQGWSRTYGDRVVFVRRQTKQALSGTVEWLDVFRRVGDGQPVDVSQCNGVNCGQPSLSQDGKLVVFVKTRAE